MRSRLVRHLARWDLLKFVVLKQFECEFLRGEPCRCLHVSVYMLKCVFCCDILPKNEFKRYVHVLYTTKSAILRDGMCQNLTI